jgi:hypothetical protein
MSNPCSVFLVLILVLRAYPIDLTTGKLSLDISKELTNLILNCIGYGCQG